jgi:hypothetical protein
VNIIRNRIINFRVSEDEFRRLKAASTLQNARCLSDFARAATLRVASNPDSDAERARNDNEFDSFDRRLATLELNVARLVEVLTNSGASVSAPARASRVISSSEVISCD